MNESYEEYIRSILGYPQTNFYGGMSPLTNYNNMNYYAEFDNTNFSSLNNSTRINNQDELEKCYPEIYKLVYPMVVKKCQNTKTKLSADDIENMTDEIYFALENREGVELNINLTNDVRTKETVSTDKTNNRADVKVRETTEKRETRQINRGLRDLIKILLLRELLNRPGHRPPFRPPHHHPRPPMTPRPPFRPRYFENDYLYSNDLDMSNPNMDIYENF